MKKLKNLSANGQFSRTNSVIKSTERVKKDENLIIVFFIILFFLIIVSVSDVMAQAPTANSPQQVGHPTHHLLYSVEDARLDSAYASKHHGIHLYSGVRDYSAVPAHSKGNVSIKHK
jgi:hypothetical protein